MLIFLDIDGVMVPATGWKIPELLDDGFPAFNRKATSALQSLISGDTTVMLTSTHKSNYSVRKWKHIFLKRGVAIRKLRCLPNNLNNLSRKDEIVNWFNVHPVNGDFLIIDDDRSLNDLPKSLKQNLIQPSPYIGLTEENLNAVR